MEKQSFWDRYARRYSHFVRADQEAYAQMLEWIRPAVRDRTVLELATGTGVIAHGIVHEAASIEATDASAGMIDVARSHSHSRKLHFSVQDMRYLPYADGSFEVVIAANVLHRCRSQTRRSTRLRACSHRAACSSCRRLRMRGRAGLQGCAFG